MYSSKKIEPSYNSWTPAYEDIIAKWANKSACYVWLHEKTHKYYKTKNMHYSIPIIILSTISGTANYGINSIFPEWPYGNIVIGTIGLFVAIISFINNFLRHAELSEAHRVANIQWSKFTRNLSTQLALHKNNRDDIDDFFIISKSEMDRLMEQSPIIPKKILKLFKNKFAKNIKNFNFELPIELDDINPTYVYNPSLSFLILVSTFPLISLHLRSDLIFLI